MSNSDESAIAFGRRMLALLETGSFTASYKYAVLTAILNALQEGADELENPPDALHAKEIGRRVLRIYWPQTRPFTDRGPLQQSPQAGNIVAKIAAFREAHHIGDHSTVEEAQRRYDAQFATLEQEVVYPSFATRFHGYRK